MIYAIALSGIALTLLAVWLTGGGRQAHIVNLEMARRRLLEDRPDLALSGGLLPGGLLSGDGRAALFALGDGGLGFVFVAGDRLATRIVTRREVTGTKIDASGTLSVATDSFTHPIFRLTGMSSTDGQVQALLAMGGPARVAA